MKNRKKKQKLQQNLKDDKKVSKLGIKNIVRLLILMMSCSSLRNMSVEWASLALAILMTMVDSSRPMCRGWQAGSVSS